MGPADSRRIPRAPRYSGYCYGPATYAYVAFTLCGGPFQALPLRCGCPTAQSYYPDGAETPTVWASPRSLAATGGITRLFSFPAGTKMFQFPALAPRRTARCPASSRAGCPIRKSADRRPFAPTRGLSQLIASFFASVSLGIRHAPFSALSACRGARRDPRRILRLYFVSSPRTPQSRGAASFVYYKVSLFLCQYVKDLRAPRAHRVENNGFEPLTPCLQSRCSSQLS
jgi:hypothetical protein